MLSVTVILTMNLANSSFTLLDLLHISVIVCLPNTIHSTQRNTILVLLRVNIWYTSVARVLFVTVAFGVGIDVPKVEKVIHIGIPYTVEDFFQETGRAGRNGNSAMSVLYYNSYDISKGKKALQPDMWKYATTQSCWREVIVCHFGASQPVLTCGRSCCDNYLECSNNSED